MRTRRNREQHGRFLAEGVRVVEDLLASGLTTRWVLTSSSLEDNPRGGELIGEVDRRRIPKRVVTDRELAGYAGTDTPQGVIAVVEMPAAPVDLLDPGGRESSLLLVLDGVQDPGNFGTLVRSAEALGAVGVIALSGTVDPWNPKSVRAAAGSSFRLPILQLPWSDALAGLRRMGYRILGADTGGTPVGQSGGGRVALVVGNEGGGLSRSVRTAVDDLVSVPLRGRAESLNVAAAAAILLYELAS